VREDYTEIWLGARESAYFQLQAHFHVFYILYCGFKVLLCVCVLVFC